MSSGARLAAEPGEMEVPQELDGLEWKIPKNNMDVLRVFPKV